MTRIVTSCMHPNNSYLRVTMKQDTGKYLRGVSQNTGNCLMVQKKELSEIFFPQKFHKILLLDPASLAGTSWDQPGLAEWLRTPRHTYMPTLLQVGYVSHGVFYLFSQKAVVSVTQKMKKAILFQKVSENNQKIHQFF